MGGKEKQAGGGEEPAGPSQPDLGRKVVPLTVRTDPFLQPLEGRGKREKAKGCCFGPPESQGKS